MLDQILQGLQNNIGRQLSDIQLPEGVQQNDVAQTAGSSIIDALKAQAGSGSLDGIMEMFSGNETPDNSPVMNSVSPEIISNLTNKLGIDPELAQNIVSKILPSAMNMFNKDVQSGNFDISSLISQFQNGGIGDIIENFTGGDKNSSGGGIFNIIKGFFGK